jgi:hypothetical protein
MSYKRSFSDSSAYGASERREKLESWVYQITRNALGDSVPRKRPMDPLEVRGVGIPEVLPDDDIVTGCFRRCEQW